MNVLVTGAAGVLGRRVVDLLVGRAHAVRAMVHRWGAGLPEEASLVLADLESGVGLADAVDGVEAIVHCASLPKRHREVDGAGTHRLAHLALRSGRPHLLYPGIVGSDVIPLAYYRSKLAAEEAIVSSGLPWTILRATQFHQLVWALLRRMSRYPLLVVPREVRVQVLDPGVVAATLVDAVDAGPAGRLPDVGGPNAYSVDDLARSFLAATGHRRPVWSVNYPGLAWAAFRAGANLTPHRGGGETWNEFVRRQLGGRA